EVVELIELVLQGQGFRVLPASSFQQAVALWDREKESVDVVLSDLGAIASKASSFSEIFKKPDLHLLYMSGSAPDEVPANISSQNFIQKPYSTSAITRFVSQCFVNPGLSVI